MEKTELVAFIGQQIKHYRKAKKLTQKELGRRINKNANTISQYENGINAPAQDSLFDLANALDISVDDFFPRKEKSISLNDTLQKNDNISVENMAFLKDLTAYFETLPPDKQENLLGRIEVAVELFKNRN